MTCRSCLIVTNQNLVELIVHSVDAAIKLFEDMSQIFLIDVLFGKADFDAIDAPVYGFDALTGNLIHLLETLAEGEQC